MESKIRNMLAYFLEGIPKYLNHIFVKGNGILLTIISLILFSSFFLLFFKIVDIDKQVKYIPVYNNKYIFDKAEISISSKELSYISGINNTFQASESSPEIMIFTDTNEITDINLKANQIFNNIGIGSAKYNNGVLVYVNTNPSPKIRIEVGYGLEDVINDAKAGRIIDNNMAKVSNKPLAEYSNDELRKLLPLIFKDITTIVADKYKIDISKKVVRSNSEKMKYNNIITIRYSIKDVEPYFIYLFITTAILLFIIIIISNFAYGLFIIALFAASGYAVYLYKSIFSVIFITTKSSMPIGIYLFEDIFSFIFVCILIVIPFIISSWREVKFERNGYVRDLHSFFKLFTYNGFSYFNIASRFIFITAVVFTVIYFFIIKAFIQYGFGNITLNIAAGIILILSILLMQYRQAYVVMLLYCFSLGLLLSTYGLYNRDLRLLCIFCAMLSIDIGYGIYYNVLGVSQRYLTFIAIFEIALLSFLEMFNRSSSKGGISRGISFRISRRGGGRSGGGGASR